MATIMREKAACVIFGAPREMPTNVLPTYADVMKAYIHTRQQLTTKNKYPPFAQVSEKVCVDVELVWKKASLPTVMHGRVIETLRPYNEKYKKILKPYKARKDNSNYKQQLEQFREDANKLFDISKCKCVDFVVSCKCERADKVPLKERKFLEDQRGARKMIIGGIDLMETTKLQNKISRKESESRRDSIHQEQWKQQFNSGSYNEEDKDDDTDNSDEEHTRSKSHCKPDLSTPKSKRQRMTMTNLSGSTMTKHVSATPSLRRHNIPPQYLVTVMMEDQEQEHKPTMEDQEQEPTMEDQEQEQEPTMEEQEQEHKPTMEDQEQEHKPTNTNEIRAESYFNRNYECDICGKLFIKKSHLTTHTAIHTGVKKFKCDECGKQFNQRGNLTLHALTHTLERNFQCTICGNTFALKGDLKRHITGHSGKRDFKCIKCGKKFTQKSNLTTHMNLHTRLKDYKCIECGKEFYIKSSLTHHVHVHVSERKHECHRCNRKFLTKVEVKTHLIRHCHD